MAEPVETFHLAGVGVQPGSKISVGVPIPGAFEKVENRLPVTVVHGVHPGPRMLVTAAIHGDELIGTEIARRLIKQLQPHRLNGTVIVVPVVNIYGLVHRSRYLPDRRDLNRSFPGSPSGSLAARLAHALMTLIATRCTHGIDLHTAAVHRENLPQIRAFLDDPAADRMAQAFGAPVVLDAELREGSLRVALKEQGIPVIVYEGGEALRLEENPVRAGLRGVWSVLEDLGMVRSRARRKRVEPAVLQRSIWVRAPQPGLLRLRVRLGQQVSRGDVIGWVSDPTTGVQESAVEATASGIVIGRLRLPLVNEGDALCHIAVASGEEADQLAGRIEEFDELLQSDRPAPEGF